MKQAINMLFSICLFLGIVHNSLGQDTLQFIDGRKYVGYVVDMNPSKISILPFTNPNLKPDTFSLTILSQIITINPAVRKQFFNQGESQLLNRPNEINLISGSGVLQNETQSRTTKLNQEEVILAYKRLKTAQTLNTIGWCTMPIYVGYYVFPVVGLHRIWATNAINRLTWPEKYRPK